MIVARKQRRHTFGDIGEREHARRLSAYHKD
jgi:hypothetical protein